MELPQALPTGSALLDQFARELAQLLGPAYQPADGTLLAEDLRVLGWGLALAYAEGTASLDESFVSSATQLLDAWERRLGIPSAAGASAADRRAALVGQRRINGSATAARLQAALEAITPVTIHRNAAADVTDCPRTVWMMAVVVAAEVWGDPSKRAALRRIIARTVPAHVRCNLGTRVGFRCDDPDSLVGRDLLGS